VVKDTHKYSNSIEYEYNNLYKKISYHNFEKKIKIEEPNKIRYLEKKN
jgi:hypothetical protein